MRLAEKTIKPLVWERLLSAENDTQGRKYKGRYQIGSGHPR